MSLRLLLLLFPPLLVQALQLGKITRPVVIGKSHPKTAARSFGWFGNQNGVTVNRRYDTQLFGQQQDETEFNITRFLDDIHPKDAPPPLSITIRAAPSDNWGKIATLRASVRFRCMMGKAILRLDDHNTTMLFEDLGMIARGEGEYTFSSDEFHNFYNRILKPQLLMERILLSYPELRKLALDKWYELGIHSTVGRFTRSQGPSMEPTIPGACRCYGVPIKYHNSSAAATTDHHDHHQQQQVKVGDVVIFVCPLLPLFLVKHKNPDSCMLGPLLEPVFSFTREDPGFVRMFVKRIVALEGDTVVFHGQQYVIPNGHCWVLGDNRDDSADSRLFGAVPLVNLRIRVVCVFKLFPPSFQWLDGNRKNTNRRKNNKLE